ncbi:MAG: hypothetical protein JWM09_229 [Francisellaceae bacterium]|nr:hypothetical protein [Francisellaceae bacterium]
MIYFLINFLNLSLKWLDFLSYTLLMYILSFLPHKINKKIYPQLFQFWCHLFIKALGVNLKLHQKNANPLPSHYIVISNHPSAFEDIGMPSLFKARYLAKKQIADWYIFGRISTAAGNLYVDRDSKESRHQSKELLIKTLLDGYNIGLYPEGGCKGRRIHLPFNYGCFDVSLKANIPIIPVFLHYEAQEAFEWTSQETLIHKIINMMRAPNKTVNYYVFDALLPAKFNNTKEYCEYVEKLYINWQQTYLE